MVTLRWYRAWPAQPRGKLELDCLKKGARRTGRPWSLRPGSEAEGRSLSGAQDHCLSAHTVGSVCLPAKERDFPRGSECWVSGWGHTDPSHSESAPRALGAQDGGWGLGGEASVPRSEAPRPPPPWPQGTTSPLLLWHHPRSDGGPRVLPGEQTGISPETRSFLLPPRLPGVPGPQHQGVCVMHMPPSKSDGPSWPESWASMSLGSLTPSSASASPVSVCDPPISHLPPCSPQLQSAPGLWSLFSAPSSATALVYSGALMPHILCADYLHGRADAC